MQPSPILFVDHSPAVGGAEFSLLLLLKHLDRKRWRPHLACVKGALAERAIQLNIDLHIVDLPRLRRSATMPVDWMRSARTLAELARKHNIALFHSNTVRASLYTAPAAKLARRPFVWHMRDFWLSETNPTRPQADSWGKRLLCGSANAVIANSYAVAGHLPCDDRVHVVHNGIEIERFDPALDGGTMYANYGVPAGVPMVGMVARLRPWKGQETFLRVAAIIHKSYPEVRFLMVGGALFQVDDDYLDHLQRLANDLGLGDRVIYTGHLDDVRPALAAMNIFVHPGRPEPFGLVNIEAMAMAKPIVAFAHGALPEIIVDGETGRLIAPGDEVTMAGEIMQLLAAPQKALEIGKAGRARVERHFTIQQTVRGVERVYGQLLEGQG